MSHVLSGEHAASEPSCLAEVLRHPLGSRAPNCKVSHGQVVRPRRLSRVADFTLLTTQNFGYTVEYIFRIAVARPARASS